ncbi:MAG: hypothetical protein ACT4NV_11620 [Rhodoferax sp.]
MSKAESSSIIDAQQIIYLPKWAKWIIITLLIGLACISSMGAVFFLLAPTARDLVVPVLSIAQTAIGGLAVAMFVLLSERQLSTKRLLEKTDQFLLQHMPDSLGKIEIPHIRKDATVTVEVIARPSGIHGHKKDIYGVNYLITLGDFRMKIWVGINVKRLSVIYFFNTTDPADIERLKTDFQFTFAGARSVGYSTNFEHALVDGESIASIWSTVFAETAILGNPSEQLFWVQDVAMMTQSVARTAARLQWKAHTTADPGPL